MSRRKNSVKVTAILLLIIILLVGLVIGIVACNDKGLRPQESPESSQEVAANNEASDGNQSSQAENIENSSSLEALTVPGEKVTFSAVGDVLIHQALINAALQEDGSYEFRPLFRHTKDIFAAADFASFDMEGTFRGAPYAGFPSFSTPEDLAPALKDSGMDIGATANNHCMDFDTPTLIRTVKILADAGIESIGTRQTLEDPKFLIKDVNGIKLGLGAFTYESDRVIDPSLRTLNQTPIPKDLEGLVDTVYVNQDRPELLEGDAKRLKARVAEMKEAGAEAIVIFAHWGTEYAWSEDFGQSYYAQVLADAGVDVVVSCGPHVIHPIKKISSQDGTHEMLCYYSLGNFVSNQYFEIGDSQGRCEDGLIALISFERGEDGKVRLSDCGYVPTYVYKKYPQGDQVEFTDAVVLPVIDALAHPEKYDLPAEALPLLEASLERTRSIMAENQVGDFAIQEYSGFFK